MSDEFTPEGLTATVSTVTKAEYVEALHLHLQAVERGIRWMDNVLTNIAAGDWRKVVQDIGDNLNAVDAVDDDLIELWNRAKAAVDAMALPAGRTP